MIDGSPLGETCKQGIRMPCMCNGHHLVLRELARRMMGGLGRQTL